MIDVDGQRVQPNFFHRDIFPDSDVEVNIRLRGSRMLHSPDRTFAMKRTIAAILRDKGSHVVTIHPEATVYETIARMVEHNVGSIVVLQNNEILGVFTERDYLRRIVLQGRTSRETIVKDVMTEDVKTATPDHTINACMRTMTEYKCRHLPILHEGKLVGVVSIGDCVKSLLEDSQLEVQHLQGFISGAYPA